MSILDHMDSLARHQHLHICGGTILVGGSGDQEHRYCDRCGAYTYDMDDDVPNGCNAQANSAAWDDGEEGSPAGEPRTATVAI